MNDIQKEKDDLAINTMQAFMDVVYYQGTVKLAAEQLEENSRILYKTRRQEELGLNRVNGTSETILCSHTCTHGREERSYC